MKYDVLVTRNATQSATFAEEASSKEEAASQALSKARAGEGDWELDDGNSWDEIYLCDSIEECVQETESVDDQEGVEPNAPIVHTLDLGIGLYIQWDGQNRAAAAIFHDLSDDQDDQEYEAAVDGITSMVLAHFCEGIDVTEPRYINGVQTALLACANNL